MPLIPPSLDDRSYDDLVQEMLANIPAHTPEWTNPQPGDPGRTLVELFAWLADTILYRANLIPEKQRIAFLNLLGQSMQPAAAATGLVSLALNPASLAPVGLIAQAKLTGAVTFETLGEIDLLPLTAQAYIKAPLTADQQAGAMPLLAGLKKLYGLSTLPAGYTTTPVFTNNQADPNGIDLTNGTTDSSLWLALLVAKPENLAPVLASIGGQNGQQILNVGFVPSISVPGLFSDVGPPAAVQATWQMSQPPISGQPNAYTTLKVLGDTTQSLTQTGIVQLLVPPAAVVGAPPNDVRADAQAGVGMKPPRIDDASIAARLLAWVRLSTQSSLQVSWLGVNAVAIDQRTTYNSIVIGVSDGSANQQFALPQTQIDPATFVLEVDMPGLGFRTWQRADDVSVLQGPVPAYVLDPEAGTVTFGNQLQGMIVPAGRRIRVNTMRAGGGVAGNLPAGSLTTIQAFDASGNQVTQTITVHQPIATTGGADPETLDQAQQRIPSLLGTQGRAVTAGDYSDLAQQIPGANVARVEVLPLFKPQTRTSDVPGVVSVMVIPGKDGVLNPCPRAGRPLLEAVYQYLDPRRPVAAEMYVIASEYMGLGISVAVEVKTGYGLLQVSQAVETALRSYLWPIAPGGPANTGWPLGRGVRSLELEVIVSQVAGVIEVNGLNLFQPLAAGGYQQLTTDASGKSELTLQSWQLPEVLEVVVAAGPDGSGIQAPTSLTPAPETDTTVAVPIVPTVC
jgi:predicted phage baseplate assembly protein